MLLGCNRARDSGLRLALGARIRARFRTRGSGLRLGLGARVRARFRARFRARIRFRVVDNVVSFITLQRLFFKSDTV